MRKYLVLIFIFITGTITAQRITLCKAYTNKGEPIDLIYSSNLMLNQSVCVLFSGENKRIAGKTVNFHIDKMSGNERENQLTKSFKTVKENWIAQVFKFLKEGKYEIYFEDELQHRFSTLTVTVGSPKPVKKVEPVINNKYINTEVVICEAVQYGRPVNVKETVSLAKGAGTINIFINAYQPLDTRRILVNIWRRSKPGLEYDEFYEVKKFEVDPDWSDTFIKYTFTKTGDYKISLFDEKEFLIKTTYISVTN